MIEHWKKYITPSALQGFTILLDQGGYSLITLFCGILLARSSCPQDYGMFVLGMSLVYMTKVIQRSLTTVPLSVFYPALTAARQPGYLVHTAILFGLITGGLVGLVLLAGGGIGRCGQTSDLTKYLSWFVGVLITTHFADLMRTVLLVQFKTFRCFCAGLINHTIAMTGLIVLYSTNRLSIVSACAVLMAAAGFSGMLGGLLTIRLSMFSLVQFAEDCLISLRYGIWILGSTLVNMLGLSLLPWITLLWWDSQTVAAIGALTLAASLIRPCQEAMVHFLTPVLSDRLATRGRSYAGDKILGLVRVIMLPGILNLLVVVFLGRWILTLLYGVRYEHYSNTLIWFTAAIVFRVMMVPIRSFMIADGAAPILTHNNITASFVSISLSFVLIPRMGVHGVAVIHLIFNLILFLEGYRYLCGTRGMSDLNSPVFSTCKISDGGLLS